MTILRSVPVVLSALLLAAHWARQGSLLLVLVTLGIPLLLLVRRAWTPIVVQGALVLGALEWVRTALVLWRARVALGEPWVRMAVILGVVAGITLASALVLRGPAVRAWYARQG